MSIANERWVMCPVSAASFLSLYDVRKKSVYQEKIL